MFVGGIGVNVAVGTGVNVAVGTGVGVRLELVGAVSALACQRQLWRYTHIDDFVESLRTVTPKGVIESRRLPGSGAGPSPDRMMIGSEGILGIITQAWMRLQDRPTYRAGGAVHFKDFSPPRVPCARSHRRDFIRRTAASSIRLRH